MSDTHDGSTHPPALVAGGLHPYRGGVSPLELRELFWQNMMREILTSLAVTARSGGRLDPSAAGAAHGAGPVDDLFDGRLAVVTALGKRIPIGDIYPVFACSIGGTQTERMLSADVQCSVFQIRTPGGEIHTIPVSEVRSFHSLTEDLVKKIEQSAKERAEAENKAPENKDKPADADKDGKPFGFAAFTQLARTLETPMPDVASPEPERPPEPPPPQPEAQPNLEPEPEPAPDPAPDIRPETDPE